MREWCSGPPALPAPAFEDRLDPSLGLGLTSPGACGHTRSSSLRMVRCTPQSAGSHRPSISLCSAQVRPPPAALVSATPFFDLRAVLGGALEKPGVRRLLGRGRFRLAHVSPCLQIQVLSPAPIEFEPWTTGPDQAPSPTLCHIWRSLCQEGPHPLEIHEPVLTPLGCTSTGSQRAGVAPRPRCPPITPFAIYFYILLFSFMSWYQHPL